MSSFLRMLATSSVVLGFGVVGLLLGSAVAVAQDDGGSTTPTMRDDCGECHLDVVAVWQDSTHAQAFNSTTFQSAWQEQGSPPDCQQCHTTNYSARTMQYEHPGVTCEACHGRAPADHPPSPVAIDPGVETCEDCHTTTITEWEHSAHGDAGVVCTDCHSAHPQGLRFETPTALCMSCHEEVPPDYAHTSHPDQSCVDCHWHHSEVDVDGIHVMSGNLLPTGHDSGVETVACTICHAEDYEYVADVEVEHPLFDARVEIAELKAEVETIETQGENTAALRMAQGFVIGMAIGGILIGLTGVVRRRKS